LHGGYVAVVEGVRRAGENFKHSQRSAEMAKGSSQNRARAETTATGPRELPDSTIL
jgi:hypothetical protein